MEPEAEAGSGEGRPWLGEMEAVENSGVHGCGEAGVVVAAAMAAPVKPSSSHRSASAVDSSCGDNRTPEKLGLRGSTGGRRSQHRGARRRRPAAHGGARKLLFSLERGGKVERWEEKRVEEKGLGEDKVGVGPAHHASFAAARG